MQDQTPWHEILNAHTGAGITGPQAKIWADELRRKFTNPPLGPEEVHNAARKLGEHLANGRSEYRRKPTLPDLIEQITWTRNKAGGRSSGEVETLEDAVCSIMRESCPHMRFSRAMAPSRAKYRMQLLEALERAGKPVQRDIRTHPRFMMRPADPHIRQQLDELRANPPGGRIDEDEYLYAVERLLAVARMEPIPRPINDPFARVAAFAAAGVARVEATRTTNQEDETWN